MNGRGGRYEPMVRKERWVLEESWVHVSEVMASSLKRAHHGKDPLLGASLIPRIGMIVNICRESESVLKSPPFPRRNLISEMTFGAIRKVPHVILTMPISVPAFQASRTTLSVTPQHTGLRAKFQQTKATCWCDR